MKLISLILGLTLLSCGSFKDGGLGPQGDDGKPGDPGKDGAAAQIVVQSKKCVLSTQVDPSGAAYPKFDLEYRISILNDQSALVSLTEKHYYRANANPNVASNALFYVKGQDGYDKAGVETTLWKAELSSSSMLVLSYKPSAFSKSVSCQ